MIPFFPGQRELENRKGSKCCWPVLRLSLLEVTGCPQLASPEFVSVLPVPEPRVHQPQLVAWASTLVSPEQYKCAPLFITRDDTYTVVPTSQELT